MVIRVGVRGGLWVGVLLLMIGAVAGCAANPKAAAIVTTEGEEIDPDGIMDIEVVVKTCAVPDLKTYFQFDSDELAAHQNLDQLAKCLSGGPLEGNRLVLVGHTDPLGSDDYNAKLGLARARKVARYLSERGVDPSRIKYESQGKARASGDPAHYPEDRRVDIIVLLH
ncbi:MAG: OmpA family protein [Deltaproteobacteria bacterium]|nr:OmpA family protein [Deltaproteobacteria bacterium]